MIVLSDMIRAMRAKASAALPAGGIREQGIALAHAAYGNVALEMSPFANIGVLAMQMQRPVVHSLRPGVCHLIDDTDLHSLPDVPPRLLQGPWVLESRHPTRGDALFGSTVSLGGYVLDGTIYLVGVDHPDGCRVAPWRPAWGDGELPDGMRVAQSSLVDADEHAEYAAWAREAARFALVAGLVLESEGAPIRIEDERPKARKGAQHTTRPEADWVTRHVTLGTKTTVASASIDGAARARDDDTDLAAVNVRGHLKRQRHGPENKLTKWIYVAEYSARRWVAPRPLKIVIDA